MTGFLHPAQDFLGFLRRKYRDSALSTKESSHAPRPSKGLSFVDVIFNHLLKQPIYVGDKFPTGIPWGRACLTLFGVAWGVPASWPRVRVCSPGASAAHRSSPAFSLGVEVLGTRRSLALT